MAEMMVLLMAEMMVAYLVDQLVGSLAAWMAHLTADEKAERWVFLMVEMMDNCLAVLTVMSRDCRMAVP